VNTPTAAVTDELARFRLDGRVAIVTGATGGIGSRLAGCEGPIRFLIPEKGVSALDIEGGAFFDPEADAVLFDAIERTIKPTRNRTMTRLPLHINDPEFAGAATAAFLDIASK